MAAALSIAGSSVSSPCDVSASCAAAASSGLRAGRPVSFPASKLPKHASLKQSRAPLRVSCFADTSSRTEGAASFYNLYSVLGLDQSVELPEIKNAYRQMARKYHPDVCPAEDKQECTRMFLQVQDAYETLSDPTRRANYDFALMQTLSGKVGTWDLGLGAREQRHSRMDYMTTELWKDQWQSQLDGLRSRQTDHMSWGARMRAKQAA